MRIGILTVCLMSAVFPAVAQQLSTEDLLKAEQDEKIAKVNEMFQEKVEKISQRLALPDNMRSLLIQQADEVRKFDEDMLKAKTEMKIKHAQQRDLLKEALRKDAENRVKWLLEDENRFQKNKQIREQEEKKRLEELSLQSGDDKSADSVSSAKTNK